MRPIGPSFPTNGSARLAGNATGGDRTSYARPNGDVVDEAGRSKPPWLIVTVAIVILVAGATWPTASGLRRRRIRRVETAITDARARIEALDYRIDAEPSRPRAEAAAGYRDTAQAILSVADDRRSARVCGRRTTHPVRRGC